MASKQNEKMDLMTYLMQLPEVEDYFPPIHEKPEELVKTKNREELLADCIRCRSMQEKLVSSAELCEWAEEKAASLEKMQNDPLCADIVWIDGNRSRYYYSNANMTKNYARIAMLVEDGDWQRTIAEMVRFNCKTYPAATPYDYFLDPPYNLTQMQIIDLLDKMSANEEYADIVRTQASNGQPYLFSTQYFSHKYGQAMVNWSESAET